MAPLMKKVQPPWGLPSVSFSLGWTDQGTSAAPHTTCSPDPSPSLWPSFGHSPMALSPSYVVVPKTIHSVWGEAAAVQGQSLSHWQYWVCAPQGIIGSLAARAHCWLGFNVPPARTSTSLPVELPLISQSVSTTTTALSQVQNPSLALKPHMADDCQASVLSRILCNAPQPPRESTSPLNLELAANLVHLQDLNPSHWWEGWRELLLQTDASILTAPSYQDITADAQHALPFAHTPPTYRWLKLVSLPSFLNSIHVPPKTPPFSLPLHSSHLHAILPFPWPPQPAPTAAPLRRGGIGGSPSRAPSRAIRRSAPSALRHPPRRAFAAA